VRVVSTHSQTLSGTLGHTFVGCAFPAPEPVRSRLVEYAGRAGRALAARGVLGHLSIDFLVGEGDAVLALETNLRMGGATAPFALLEGLLAGRCEARDGRYLHPDGDERCYVASDRVHRPALEGRTAAEAITAVERSGLAFRPDSGTGVALFALGAVGEFGKLGILAVERSAAKAEELFDAALEALDGVTRPH
ncbi:MAG TPA: peptide ligase PGM1-related protein, partial [Kineosporiaceae bacterium]